MNFDKKQTLSLKGVAILIMIFHHLFLGILQMADAYGINCFPISQNRIHGLAVFGKVCIYMFAFVSGYGLWIDYSRTRDSKSVGKWMIERYIKTFSAYWFIFVIEFIYHIVNTNLIQSAFFANYSRFEGCFYVLLNFLGVHNIFSTPTLDASWWYMSAVIVIIGVIPLICRASEKLNPEYLLFLYILIQTLILGCAGYNTITSMISQISTAFIGMYCADIYIKKQVDVLSIGNSKNWSKTLVFLISVLCLLISYKIYPVFNEKTVFMVIQRGILPLPLIYFTLRYIAKVPGLQAALSFIGKHSNNMYLVHFVFLGNVCFGNFNYFIWLISNRNFIVIFIIFTITVLLLSIVLECLKKIVFYDKAVKKLISCILKSKAKN